jgi:hypothetical protein
LVGLVNGPKGEKGYLSTWGSQFPNLWNFATHTHTQNHFLSLSLSLSLHFCPIFILHLDYLFVVF